MPSADIRQKVFRVPSNIVLSVGLCWDFIGPEPVDLDLSAVCFTKDGQFLDVVFFNHLFPEDTDEEVLRAEYLVDPAQLPYMFLSGDSTIGGEEENQTGGIALAARRRKFPRKMRRGGRPNAAESIFNRLYEEEELADVQRAMDEHYAGGGEQYDEAGELIARAQHRGLSEEVLTFVMHKIPKDAEVIFLSVTSYTGLDFTTLPLVKLVIYNETTNQRVGSIDLKPATGSGTANLGCMLLRAPPESTNTTADCAFWDLREMNIRTYGYSFVDVIPIMQDVIGIPPHSRLDALRNIPDYSLVKGRQHQLDQPLSDVRFGVGWDGEHDVDAFLVMLDASNNYVDHVYPKQGKLRAAVPDLSRHSGDAMGGTDTNGDEEFVDLLTYRLPPNVRTVLVGATYMESYGKGRSRCHSIYDVPRLYMRLQNRSMEAPYSFELDRWDVHNDATRRGGPAAPRHYTSPNGPEEPVRTLLLGVMVKRQSVPFETLFPGGRRIDQVHRRAGSAAPSTVPEAPTRSTVAPGAPAVSPTLPTRACGKRRTSPTLRMRQTSSSTACRHP